MEFGDQLIQIEVKQDGEIQVFVLGSCFMGVLRMGTYDCTGSILFKYTQLNDCVAEIQTTLFSKPCSQGAWSYMKVLAVQAMDSSRSIPYGIQKMEWIWYKP